jgi:hypothetical protein
LLSVVFYGSFIPNSAHVKGVEARGAAFKKAYKQLSRRIQMFMNLPLEKMDKLALQEQLTEIGRIKDLVAYSAITIKNGHQKMPVSFCVVFPERIKNE